MLKEKILITIGILIIILGTVFNVWRFQQISKKMNISFTRAVILFLK